MQLYRDGVVAPRGRPVGARTPEDAIRFVGQTLELMGRRDFRKIEGTDKIDPRIHNCLKSWSADDPAPKRVKPIPVQVLYAAQEIASANGCLAMCATARIMWTGFFFLRRPGEYCSARSGNKFFTLADV